MADAGQGEVDVVASPVPSLKMLGLGLATAILIDATVVRMVLVPATMSLLGKANGWLPGWLDLVLPHLTVEGFPEDTPLHAAPHAGQASVAVSTSSEDQLASR